MSVWSHFIECNDTCGRGAYRAGRANKFDAKTKPIVLGRVACSKSMCAADAAEFACSDEAFLFEIIDGIWRDTLWLRHDAEVDRREISVGYLIFPFT